MKVELELPEELVDRIENIVDGSCEEDFQSYVEGTLSDRAYTDERLLDGDNKRHEQYEWFENESEKELDME